MPVSRGRPTPVIVEMRPSNAAAYDDEPKTPSSPKNVRFAPPSAGLVRSTREATDVEVWSLYRFEEHAHGCDACHDPAGVHARGQRLCETGRHLAADVTQHLFHADGDVYSVHRDARGQADRVEFHREYRRARALLKSLAPVHSLPRAPTDPLPRRHRTVPIISHERHEEAPVLSPSYVPSSTRRTTPVVLEPAHTSASARHANHPSGSKSKHKSTRYRTVVVVDDVAAQKPMRPTHDSPAIVAAPSLAAPSLAAPSLEAPSLAAPSSSSSSSSRRGSLYESDLVRARQREQSYRIEVREPSSRHGGREKGNEVRR